MLKVLETLESYDFERTIKELIEFFNNLKNKYPDYKDFFIDSDFVGQYNCSRIVFNLYGYKKKENQNVG